MPELVEQMYCSQQIVIPPKFPYILKRYCKAAIKTQPYDLLRWSFEYFKALAERRPPPVKLRLEYPVYSTEGGLTRGCLKVLANQLASMTDAPLDVVRAAWQGFCLDPEELNRIFCLCEVYLREESVPVLSFIAVAAGMLTKSLTHTMILLCETLTKEPDGGSAAIPVKDFLQMYIFLAKIDASKDVRYINGFREGYQPVEDNGEEESEVEEEEDLETEFSDDDYWENIQQTELQRLTLINDRFAKNPRLSVKAAMPIIEDIERSPSVERARELERANYLSERRAKPLQSEEIDAKLRELGYAKFSLKKKEEESKEKQPTVAEEVAPEPEAIDFLPINVFDEDGNPVEIEYYGEPTGKSPPLTLENITASSPGTFTSEPRAEEQEEEEDTRIGNLDDNVEPTEAEKIAEYVATCYNEREERREDLLCTFIEIGTIVDRFKSAFYDLGMVAGRQMSTTSGEFIVAHIQKDILAYIDEQIAILPDPDLKKKRAKPEEVAMIRQMLNDFVQDHMSVIVPEVEKAVEEEEVIPEITVVYAVPGIGPPVEDEMINEFEEYALEACKVQSDVFMPRNIRHFMCPPLEKYVEINYDMEPHGKKEKKPKKIEEKDEEKCATGGGTIAD